MRIVDQHLARSAHCRSCPPRSPSPTCLSLSFFAITSLVFSVVVTMRFHSFIQRPLSIVLGRLANCRRTRRSSHRGPLRARWCTNEYHTIPFASRRAAMFYAYDRKRPDTSGHTSREFFPDFFASWHGVAGNAKPEPLRSDEADCYSASGAWRALRRSGRRGQLAGEDGHFVHHRVPPSKSCSVRNASASCCNCGPAERTRPNVRCGRNC